MRWERMCEKIEVKLMFPSRLSGPLRLPFLKPESHRAPLQGSSAACPNHRLLRAGLSAQLEM